MVGQGAVAVAAKAAKGRFDTLGVISCGHLLSGFPQIPKEGLDIVHSVHNICEQVALNKNQFRAIPLFVARRRLR